MTWQATASQVGVHKRQTEADGHKMTKPSACPKTPRKSCSRWHRDCLFGAGAALTIPKVYKSPFQCLRMPHGFKPFLKLCLAASRGLLTFIVCGGVGEAQGSGSTCVSHCPRGRGISGMSPNKSHLKEKKTELERELEGGGDLK